VSDFTYRNYQQINTVLKLQGLLIVSANGTIQYLLFSVSVNLKRHLRHFSLIPVFYVYFIIHDLC